MSWPLEDRGVDRKAELGAVRGAAQHLLALVTNGLDLSKIESGRMSLVLEPVPLSPLFDPDEAMVDWIEFTLRREGAE